MNASLLKGALARLMVTMVFLVSGYVPRRLRVSEEADSSTGSRRAPAASGRTSGLPLRPATRS